MSGIAFDSDNLLEDDPEVFPFGVSGTECAGHVFPAHPSWANKLSCSASLFICISHLLHQSDLLQKESGARAGQSGPRSSHTKILTRASPANDIHRRKFSTVELCDVPHMDHGGKMMFRHLDGERLDLAGPHRLYPALDRSQGKPTDPIEQTSKCEPTHFAAPTACTMVRVVLTADCAA